VFAASGIDHPPGSSDLRDAIDLADAVTTLRREQPHLQRAVIKLEEGFSGEGNAICDLRGLPLEHKPGTDIARELLRRIRPVAPGLDAERFVQKFADTGGVVEGWIGNGPGRSPSVQMRITPLGELELISTHDQVLGGAEGQVFHGSVFPADEIYRVSLQRAGLAVGRELAGRGALGRFSVDFVSQPNGNEWTHYGIEINLRKGGTTLPFQMLQFLTGGTCDPETGEFRTPTGQVRAYYATDNLCRPEYRRLIPEDLVDIVVAHRLHFDQTRQQGVIFNLVGALSEHGKLSMICIADSPENARSLHVETAAVLDRETGVTAAQPIP
jgi:hypothetical protein